MKTSVTKTSIYSYDAMRANGFNGQHHLILSKMVQGRIYSRRELATMTGLETSAVAGRCNEMIVLEQIEVCGHIKCPITHRQVEGVKLVGQQQELLN